jgi:hypothetical protein
MQQGHGPGPGDTAVRVGLGPANAQKQDGHMLKSAEVQTAGSVRHLACSAPEAAVPRAPVASVIQTSSVIQHVWPCLTLPHTAAAAAAAAA